MVGKRPEHTAPPQLHYNKTAAVKYLRNNRMNLIQKEMTERALELLRITPNEVGLKSGRKSQKAGSSTPLLILDVGCGIGLSGEVIEGYGHYWHGVDVSRDMLTVGHQKRDENEQFEDSNDVMVENDIGAGLPFRPASFDAAISISTLQWLCNADAREHIPQLRLKKFFQSLFLCLRRGSRAVFQLYPENDKQMQMIMNSAKRAGFGGGLVVDYPHSSTAKKYYLVLSTDREQSRMTATPRIAPTHNPQSVVSRKRSRESSLMDNSSDSGETSMSDYSAQEDDESHETTPVAEENGKNLAFSTYGRNHQPRRGRQSRQHRDNWKPKKGSKSWILLKKEQQRLVGKPTAKDSKYTGRKRPRKF
ncbi:putative methyltransferase WBSCR22-like protein [Perkinsela sp. CCAP 1560/4]|nr:putative methyltransferase WBSCR22-like protein [Perkinsela sp. CCAP 1560/4]|eukprot:KNH07498.1 putative methyltransferase WBSCR22-like protein [Perkinsela sp. CCAP 1560/4]